MLRTLRIARTVLVFAPFAIAVMTASDARAANRYVWVRGDDANNDCLVATTPCHSIGRAIAQSASGDVINVAQGKYRENLRIDFSTTLTFLGGWDPLFILRDPAAHRTNINSAKVTAVPPGSPKRDRLWAIHSPQLGVDITVVLDGFMLSHGFATTQPPTPSGDPNDHWEDGGALDATARGGSVHVNVRNSIVTRNKARNGGGGLSAHAFDGGTVSLVLENVVVTRNKTQTAGGGGIALAGVNSAGPAVNQVTLSATNCVIADNRAHGTVPANPGDPVLLGGGAIWSSSSSSGGSPGSLITLALLNSTLVDNRAEVVGGIALTAAGGLTDVTTLELQNTILAGNRDEGGFGDLLMQSETVLTVNADHSDIGTHSATGGTFNDLGGNLSVDPGLGPKYHLSATSPLVDAADCTIAPSLDLDGDPRPSGPSCDIGADEVH